MSAPIQDQVATIVTTNGEAIVFKRATSARRFRVRRHRFHVYARLNDRVLIEVEKWKSTSLTGALALIRKDDATAFLKTAEQAEYVTSYVPELNSSPAD